MKKKFIIFTIILCTLTLFLFVLPACETDEANGSIKSITKPYITEYECKFARLGNTDLLENYDYIKITLIDSDTLELKMRSKKGKTHSYTGGHTYDDTTHELNGEMGMLGIKFREKIIIEDGKFTIKRMIFSKPLVMNFEAKG